MRAISRVLAVVGCLAVLAACSAPGAAPLSLPASSTASTVIPAPAQPMVGVYEPGVPGYSRITQFTHATGVKPAVVLYYSGWGESFQARFANTAWSRGAYTLVQLQPSTVTLASVAAGYSDPYLKRFADQVRAFRHPVILSFGHEMNGNWYSWGNGHAAPSVFVAAWQHIVTLFRDEGADNATWLWTVNAINIASPALKEWWPGSQYVNWVGIDGYYYFPSDTFANVFGGTITEIRKFTSAPVLISETAVPPGQDAAAQVRGLFAGVKADHLLGLVWFDQAQDHPPYHLDWHLADDPTALAAFTAAAKGRR